MGPECICFRIAPDYAADLFVPILDRGRNPKEMEIGSSTMYSVHASTKLFILLLYKNCKLASWLLVDLPLNFLFYWV